MAAHQARCLAGGGGAVDARMLAAVLEDDAVHGGAAVGISVLAVLGQRVCGALTWYRAAVLGP